jgi:polyisoprenoid-binding protein YceI
MNWKIDPSHSLVEFSVKHMMITTVRGRFDSFEGTLHVNEENPQASYVEGSIDAISINTHDEQRDNHLRSADFFDAQRFPKITFRSTRIEPAGDNRFRVYGDLAIKGTTREVVFDVAYEGRMKDPWGSERLGFSATTKINRKDYGLTWNVPLEAGGWLVGDEIKISAEIEAVQEQPQVVPEQAEMEAVPA